MIRKWDAPDLWNSKSRVKREETAIGLTSGHAGRVVLGGGRDLRAILRCAEEAEGGLRLELKGEGCVGKEKGLGKGDVVV